MRIDSWGLAWFDYTDKVFDAITLRPFFDGPAPSLPESFVNFSAGFGDAILLGFGDNMRDALDIGSGDECSDAYEYGSWASFALGVSRLAYAGAAKGYSLIASSGMAASAFRNQLKNYFRLGRAKNWRKPDLSKYGTDAELRAAAGRTNTGMNAYGAGVAAAGAAGGSGCGCNR